MPEIVNDVVELNVSLGEDARIFFYEDVGADANFYNLCVIRATITEVAPEIPTTCTGSDGFQSQARGPVSCTVDLEAQWRWADNPFSNPPNLDVKFDGWRTAIFPDWQHAGDTFWMFPKVFIVSRTVVIDAQGVQTWTMQFKSQGLYWSPSRASGLGVNVDA